jgi:Phosphorylated adapter RNA export protein, RNA-binding domain
MATADAVNKLIEALNETDEQPRKQIAEIVEVLGDDVALGLLSEVRSVQDTGGLAVRDGTRQRTLGGVFFSLAKAKLPKADRNRIFRLRPPKPVGEEPASQPPPPQPKAAPAPPRPIREDDGRRRVVEFSASPKGNTVGGGGLGRRRVVDVEILRQSPKPAPPPVPLVAVREPEAAQPAEQRKPEADTRPLRRIVTLGPREEPPPTTPDAAIDRVRGLLKALGAEDQRRVLSELLADLGGAKVQPPPKPENGAREVDPALRERVLAAVADRLSLSTSDLARVLYGDETAGTRNKARAVLERWRRED